MGNLGRLPERVIQGPPRLIKSDFNPDHFDAPIGVLGYTSIRDIYNQQLGPEGIGWDAWPTGDNRLRVMTSYILDQVTHELVPDNRVNIVAYPTDR